MLFSEISSCPGHCCLGATGRLRHERRCASCYYAAQCDQWKYPHGHWWWTSWLVRLLSLPPPFVVASRGCTKSSRQHWDDDCHTLADLPSFCYSASATPDPWDIVHRVARNYWGKLCQFSRHINLVFFLGIIWKQFSLWLYLLIRPILSSIVCFTSCRSVLGDFLSSCEKMCCVSCINLLVWWYNGSILFSWGDFGY